MNRLPFLAFLNRLWPLNKAARQQRGFTLVEVMMAFAIIVIVLVGLTSALTASMRLNTVQKQRALAQDVIRDVMSTYIKNEPYEDLLDGCTLPCTKTIYDAGSNIDNLDDYPSLPSYLVGDLKALHDSNLELVISSINRTADEVYESKVNVLARLSWNGGKRVIEMPAVVGEGDLTRTARARFSKPKPTPNPIASGTVECTGLDEIPLPGAPCCAGLKEENDICVVDVANLVCANDNQDPDGPGKDGTCCTGLDLVGGLCVAPGPVCLPASTVCTEGVLGTCNDCCNGFTPAVPPSGMGAMATPGSPAVCN